MKSDILYILSNKFPYDKLICSDAGPQYARDMGWKSAKLNEVNFDPSFVYIIDNRITLEDISVLNDVIKGGAWHKIIFTIIDPYYENCKGNHYYLFLESLIEFENILFISKYEYKEWVYDFSKKIGLTRILWLPYPYLIEKEINNAPIRYRKSKIIFSGAVNKNIYPYRYSFWRRNTRSLFRIFIDFLPHSSYPDVGNRLIHNIIGDQYVSFLAKYKFMFLCPSRCSIEFLKYRECAYAGCLPIGLMPHSLDSLKTISFSKRINMANFLFYLIFTKNEDLENMVQKYRSFFRINRNPGVLNEQLLVFLKNNKFIV